MERKIYRTANVSINNKYIHLCIDEQATLRFCNATMDFYNQLVVNLGPGPLMGRRSAHCVQ